MDNEKTIAPVFSLPNNDYKFDKREYPRPRTYDPGYGIKECNGVSRGITNAITWLSKDKLTFHVKFNLGPYDFKSK